MDPEGWVEQELTKAFLPRKILQKAFCFWLHRLSNDDYRYQYFADDWLELVILMSDTARAANYTLSNKLNMNWASKASTLSPVCGPLAGAFCLVSLRQSIVELVDVRSQIWSARSRSIREKSIHFRSEPTAGRAMITLINCNIAYLLLIELCCYFVDNGLHSCKAVSPPYKGGVQAKI